MAETWVLHDPPFGADTYILIQIPFKIAADTYKYLAVIGSDYDVYEDRGFIGIHDAADDTYPTVRDYMTSILYDNGWNSWLYKSPDTITFLDPVTDEDLLAWLTEYADKRVPAVNKVDINGETVIDLTADTVTPETLDAGVTAHNSAGEVITGTREAVSYPLPVSKGGTGATTAAGAREAIGAGTSNFVVAGNAGAHNAIYRGKNLGTSVTAAQWAAIAAGTFEDMYIGDYWVIGGVTYRIAAFDYYYKTGDTFCDTHHVTLVPDTNMYTHLMNDTNVTTGAYVGSKMYTTGLSAAKTTINNAFGSTHILNHRQYLKNAVTNGYESAGSWYDSTVELMTEQNVYGGKVFANCTQGTNWAAQYTVDKSQYPLFTHRPDMISNRQWFWLRDVASAINFCLVTDRGGANYGRASDAVGVRPAFSIKS